MLRRFVRWANAEGRMPAEPLETMGRADEPEEVRRKMRALPPAAGTELVVAPECRPWEQAEFFVEVDGGRLTDGDRRQIGVERSRLWATQLYCGI